MNELRKRGKNLDNKETFADIKENKDLIVYSGLPLVPCQGIKDFRIPLSLLIQKAGFTAV